MPQVSPASTPRVTVSVPVPQPMPKPPPAPPAPPPQIPQATPAPQPAPAPAPGQPQVADAAAFGPFGPPPWYRAPEPEFTPRQFVEAHSLILPYMPPPKKQYRPQGAMPFRRGGRPARFQHHSDFASSISHSGKGGLGHPDTLPSLVYADHLAESGQPAAEAVVRNAIQGGGYPEGHERNDVRIHNEINQRPGLIRAAEAS